MYKANRGARPLSNRQYVRLRGVGYTDAELAGLDRDEAARKIHAYGRQLQADWHEVLRELTYRRQRR